MPECPNKYLQIIKFHMTKFYKIALSLLIVGLLFKFLHIHFNGLLLTLGGILLFIHSIIFLANNFKMKLLECLGFLTFSTLSVYLIFRIQYWRFSQILLLITILLTVIWLIVFISSKSGFNAFRIFLIFYFLFSMVVAYTPAYKICYLINFNIVLNRTHKEYDYYSWDKYSWFLYGIGKQTEAIEANKKATVAAEKAIEAFNYPEARSYIEIIKHHKLLIETKNWKDYQD
jgi:hypothetical protein